MIYSLLRKALFLLDAESVHEFAAKQMEQLGTIPVVIRSLSTMTRAPLENATTIWDLRFANRIGIAAGFDKNAVMVPMLSALGFGFVEVGTVTLHPQPGNPRPRMFRLKNERALINRLGFNNEGASIVADRLANLAAALEQDVAWPRVPLFVNIGKNRDVSLQNAVSHYEECYRIVAPFVDGVVVNVSSPNTPGLRDLQNPEQLSEILRAVKIVRSGLNFVRKGVHPILVKIAPDLGQSQLEGIAAVCLSEADGMIATNTTVSREGLPVDPDIVGGLSGRPLLQRSTEILRRLRALVGPTYPLVGVGGVLTIEDAEEKRNAGADLVQAYTGFVYEGPAFAARIARKLR